MVGNCSAVVAEGDAAVAAQLAREVAKAQVRNVSECLSWFVSNVLRQHRCGAAGKGGGQGYGAAGVVCIL